MCSGEISLSPYPDPQLSDLPSALRRYGRLPTSAEQQMITSLFQSAINFAKVRIYPRKLLPFQFHHTAITPFGRIYFPPIHYQPDFTQADFRYQHWFMHEIVHVWQHQMGMNVVWRGLFSFCAPYHYDLQQNRLLSDFGMEQQACIIADYFVLTVHGFAAWLSVTRQHNPTSRLNKDYWADLYQFTLMLFLTKPMIAKILFP